ncbi:ABC-2 type transport system ATP-binding protein [Hamadaea flava]|uniref:Alpha/beta fold hydrolase n=1 Tax=Hamadaea flava TaxID=1742688 RepID=A0ABV8M350_9ACTN|nr:alpha/beta fold hydrolase [Hamadaea flava]MCP2325758.1 ABC-2 type transport system ATP-binding protein [Hamadaea flava]
MRSISRRLVGVVAAIGLAVAAVAIAAQPAQAAYQTVETMVPGAQGDDPAVLDTTLYLPSDGKSKHPAVLLAHGFGGTKLSVAQDAKDLADRGYAVLTYSARGFGRSTGHIHLDAPQYEIKDAQLLLDWLAARTDIELDGAGDPKVGVVGGSYGGGLALLLAAYDQRVDAIVPMITWNDLGTALVPNGVFKQAWAGVFFAGGASAMGAPAKGAGAGDPACGRWAADVCAAYLKLATTGVLDDQTKALLGERSPAGVLNRIKAPTLLVQGEADTLFPLSEADANAHGITNAPVRVAWFTGGHDGGDGAQSDQDRVKFLMLQWLDHYVRGDGDAPSTSFTYSRVTGLDAVERGRLATGYSVDAYPGMGGDATTTVELSGRAQEIASPPNGSPAAVSSLPGAGAAASLLSSLAADLPGQHARFDTEPISGGLTVVGSPKVRIKVASPTGEATIFVKLYDVAPDGTATLDNGLLTPLRLTGLPASLSTAQPVEVTLPGIVHRVEDGNRLRLVVATADQAYLGPVDPVTYSVDLAAAQLTLPTVNGTPIQTSEALWVWVLAGLVAALIIGVIAAVVIARIRGRRKEQKITEEYAETPLSVKGLRKTYGKFVAVDEISFTVERGQVVGLLGPNGAGKTTSLRVLMGLTQATAGDVLIFGHKLAPGAPVLSRIGALVEGPGFLPHLTGEQNLRAYWRATGRPWEDAQFTEALAIAGLGDAIHRRVKTYSHGMKQRLAVAQAMLGLPELLVLDEPTDGLDPPQIAEMRRVLQRYAVDGRAVLVSSHLLAEVEQTCTHAVVVHKGRVVASGRVDEIVGDTPTTQFEVNDLDLAQKVLDRVDGVAGYAVDGDRTLVADLGEVSRSEAVAALVRAGVGVDRVTPRRRLEDAFLALVGDSTAGSGDR